VYRCDSQVGVGLNCDATNDQRAIIRSNPLGVFPAWGLWALCEHQRSRRWFRATCDWEAKVLKQEHVWESALPRLRGVHDTEAVGIDADYWETGRLMELRLLREGSLCGGTWTVSWLSQEQEVQVRV
jgi:hypothetical protein